MGTIADDIALLSEQWEQARIERESWAAELAALPRTPTRPETPAPPYTTRADGSRSYRASDLFGASTAPRYHDALAQRPRIEAIINAFDETIASLEDQIAKLRREDRAV